MRSRAQDFLDYFDAPAGASFDPEPEQALAFFRAKGLRPTFDWRDVFGDEHVNSFTIAKMADTDLLADVQRSLGAAMASGQPFAQWAAGITPLLQARGWWGRQAVTDPLTGATIVAQLGSPSRLATIFRTNMQAAYAVGAWQQIEDQADLAPFLLYDAVDDHRTRPEHAAYDDQVHRVDSPFWDTHYPPNGWNCRCSVIQLSAEDLQELGLEESPERPMPTERWVNPRTGKTERIAQGTDPGFSSNPGRRRIEDLAKLAREKAVALPPADSIAALRGLEEARKLAAETMEAELSALARLDSTTPDPSAAMASAQRAAQRQLDEALAERRPYLAAAIRQLQATVAGRGMTPAALLEAATAKAARDKLSAALADYRKAVLAGRKPPPAAVAAFDGLPEEARLALREKLDAELAATSAPAFAFRTDTPAAAYQGVSWANAPAWMRSILLREQDVGLLRQKGGAWARNSSEVNMPPDLGPDTAHGRDVWRHEFGHILDHRLGSAKGRGYVSAGPDFTGAMTREARELLARTVTTARLPAKREAYLKGYTDADAEMAALTSAAARRASLDARANAAGVNLERLREFLDKESAQDFTGRLEGDQRMARLLLALERRDAERFIAELVGLSTGPGARAADYFLRLRAGWKKGSASSFSDLIGAITRNKAADVKAGFWGHSNGYYTKSRGYGQQTEAFANLTALAASESPLWWELVQAFFPELAAQYRSTINAAGP
jgi:SPP1 gp7 family putative phage head morphogenesis protein